MRSGDVGIYLAPESKTAHWAKYGICETAPNMDFPISKDGFAIGIDPAISNFPCTVSLQDSAGVTYQFKIKSADVPPNPIWPFWPERAGIRQERNRLFGFVRYAVVRVCQ